MDAERRLVRVTGTVQGVGFRPFVYRVAVELGLSGYVANDSQGVLIDAEGPSPALDELSRRLAEQAPPLARVTAVEARSLPVTDGDGGFRIVESREEGAPAVAVSVDVATCADCLAELLDPADRRFEYPFINCTNCGPRYTIIQRIPYDRASTTMSVFPMCPDCRREYEDPANRRFHAEPNACPVCGPHLTLLTPDGRLLGQAGEALDAASAIVEAGEILAVKGLGGYHLAVDAASSAGVGELRRRKARDDKPFALMVESLDAARALCELSPEAEATLCSPRRPIVLAPRRPDAPVAEGVAPRLPELGLMLPYTPMHHLLMNRLRRPLVMTSGNLSDEPIAHDDADALQRLGPMVDALLTHDRGIHIRCDDSVVRSLPGRGPNPGLLAQGGAPTPPGAVAVASQVQMVRRSRGYAPEPLALPFETTRRVLAVGAELKNTVAVAKDRSVVASHHIGDLEHLPAYRSFLQAVEHLCHITGVDPEVVAHDLHPEYLSTKFALDLDLPTVGVQHHHGHIASCLVEHGRTEPVLGVAFDGTGMGTDGTIWGGELMVADLAAFRRVGHLRTVPLPGGNQAIREPWRMALSWLHAAMGPGAAERYGQLVDERWAAVLALVERPTTLVTSSAGRLFDAVAALLGIRPRVTYEAQAAIELEARATAVAAERAPAYPAALLRADDQQLVIDPSPLVAEVVNQRDRGVDLGVIAAGFHEGLARVTAAATSELAGREGLDTVALSGGVFQNARLTEAVVRHLTAAGLHVLVHERVPPNDGGVSIGQAGIAAAASARRTSA